MFSGHTNKDVAHCGYSVTKTFCSLADVFLS